MGIERKYRPLVHEIFEKRNFSELAGVVACLKDWKIAVKSGEEFLFWVGFGLASEIEYIVALPTMFIVAAV